MKKARKKVLLIVLAILPISTTTKSATLNQLLSAYCIPSNAANCIGNNKAIFTGNQTSNALTTNYCKCNDVGLYYDKQSRSCKACEEGTYTKDYTSTQCQKIPCPEGQIWEVVSTCPSGQIKSTDF